MRERISAVRRELVQEGPVRSPDFRRMTLPESDCDLLRDLLIADRVETVVEVGLAFGSSALAVGEALVAVGRPNPRHIIIDPFQRAAFGDVGWEALRAAGLDAIATLVAEPSSLALARMVMDGVVADAAFVDGSHRFHEVFVDFYYLRRIVRPGGLIVLDDYYQAPVRAAVTYYERNLGWAEVPFIGGSVRDGGPRCRAVRLPDPSFEPPFRDFRPF